MSVGNNFNRRNSKSRTHSVNNSSGFNRPRRFSLLYSSSDDEEEDDDDDNDNLSENNNNQLANLKNRRKSKSVSKPTPGSNSNTEMKMMALRNKLKLLKSATINNNNNNHKDQYNDHLSSNNSLQSNAKMRKQQQQQQNLISSSSDDDDENDDDDDDKTSSDDEKDIKPFSLNNKKDDQNLPNLKTVSDLSDLSESPDLELSKTTGDDNDKEEEGKEKTDHKSASISSDELNEKELLKAISSESDVEQEEEDLILEDDFSMDLDLDLDLEDEKHIYNKNNNSLEMFSNVAEVPSFKNHSDIFVAEDEEEEEEDVDVDINLGKDNNNKDDDDDDDDDDEDVDDDEDDYDEMLLEAALITDSESTNGHLVHSSLSNNEDDENEDNDDTNNDNVFINVDDLDPHSFYFDNEIDEDEDDDEEDNEDDNNNSRNPFFQDEESTDEEQELPEISNKIKTRSRSIHNLHDSAFGKNLPKLNCWKADGRRPFSIIDGLSTKSLYSIAIEDDDDEEDDNDDDQENDDDDEDDDSISSNGNNAKDNLLTPASKISFPGITKRKNSFFAARANINDQLLEEATSNDTTPKLRSHEKPKPLESKNIVHDFSMDQLIAISSSDNKEEDEEQEDDDDEEEDDDDDDENNGEVDETATQLPPSATNSTEEIQMVFHKDKKDNDDGDEDLFTENGLNALMNKELIIEFPAPSGTNPLDQFRRNSLTNFQNHLNSDNSDNHSKLGSADFALIQQLTQQQQDPLAGSTANRRGSVIMEEAKEGQLRYTKSGLFSEAVMMNLEEFISSNSANGGEVQFEVDGLSFN